MNQKISRITSLDITRFVAIMIMLGNHIIHATLDAKLEATNAYQTWNFYRSFTAPLFLTISGCVFFIATKVRWDTHTFFSKPFNKRLARSILLIILGIVLQLPSRHISGFESINEYRIVRLVGCDILRLIGFMLIFFEIMVVTIRKEHVFIIVAAIMFVAGIIASPFVWQISWGPFPQKILMGLINGNIGDGKTSDAVFTFFPYGIYMFGGVLIGWFWTRESVLNDNAKRWFFLLLGGVLFLYIGYLVNNNVDQEWINPRTKPAMFLKQFGAAILYHCWHR